MEIGPSGKALAAWSPSSLALPAASASPLTGRILTINFVFRWLILAALALLPTCASAANKIVPVAGPYIKHVSPPAVCRGRTNRIEVFGRELDEAFDVWTSVPGVRLSTTRNENHDAGHASFDIDVPAGAPLGLYGLRVATKSGLSNMHLFLVDELPIQPRTDRSATPSKVSLPAAIHGTCLAATVDRYEIEVQAGQAITFEVVGNRLGKDYDPLVTIRDQRGRIVTQRDNDPGLFFDCRFQHTFADGGAYFVDVRDARFAGDPAWHYLLRMGNFPVARVAVPSSVTVGETAQIGLPQIPGASVDVTLPSDAPPGKFFHELRLGNNVATWIPLYADRGTGRSPASDQADSLSHDRNPIETEPNDDRDAANRVTIPATLHGVLQSVGDVDCFTFEMKQGKMMTFRGEARAIGSPADLELVLLNHDGREVRRIDDVVVHGPGENWSADASFDFSAPKDGIHTLCVRDMAGEGGAAYAYRVEVTASVPRLELKSAVSRVTLPRENYQPIPLTLTRSHFAGPVVLELIGAPAGVTLEPTVIPADATEIVCRLKASGVAPASLTTIQIVGRWKSDDEKNKPSAEALASTFPLIDSRVKDKDLRMLAMRDDQIHPPPSLLNRLALLVTPPAPFDVQLPREKLLVTKYIDARFPIATTRRDNFASPITFAAQGGQIGDEVEERSNVFLRLPIASADSPQVAGLVFNRILTSPGKFRVDFSATAADDARRVTLHRTFEMEVKSAFAPAPETANIEIEPAGIARVRLLANRTPAFDGAVALTLTPLNGFEHPEKVEIAAGQPHVNVDLRASPETKPGRYQLRCVSRGNVGKYEEEVRGPNITITIKKPPVEKKP